MAARKPSLGLSLLFAAAVFVSVTCGASSTPAGTEARSAKPRIANPEVPAADIVQAVQGNNAFALDLYQELRKNEAGNIIYSPYSISTAIAMTYAGASGETEAQIARSLHFLAQDKQPASLNAIDLALARAPAQKPEGGGDPLQLEIANSLWGQRDYDLASSFLDTLALYYGAGVRLVKFREDPEGSRQMINAWVSQQTHERIRELIPKGVIDDMTRLVLANTVFFKASWELPFDPSLTKDGPFHLLDGSDIQIPTMSLDEELGYAQLDGAQAVHLPYAGGQASMLVIVPDQGNFASFETGLSTPAVDSAVQALQRTSVRLSMPKFDFASEFSLSGALKALGMPLAFDPVRADFSGMNSRGSRELYIQEVVHKANITVDEHGTEAAAATGVVVGVTGAPVGPVTLTIDRPFIFVIRDDATGAILFAGRVLNPAES
jgi:serpin B